MLSCSSSSKLCDPIGSRVIIDLASLTTTNNVCAEGQGACVYNKIGDFSYAQQLQGKQKNVKRKKERKISFEIAL